MNECDGRILIKLLKLLQLRALLRRITLCLVRSFDVVNRNKQYICNHREHYSVQERSYDEMPEVRYREKCVWLVKWTSRMSFLLDKIAIWVRWVWPILNSEGIISRCQSKRSVQERPLPAERFYCYECMKVICSYGKDGRLSTGWELA